MEPSPDTSHQPSPDPVVLVGIPYDESSSYLRGAAQAPEAIRATLRAGFMNWSAENGLDLGAGSGWRDLGDLQIPGKDAAFTAIKQEVRNFGEAGARLLLLGGDHSITYPILSALAPRYPDLTVLQIDAHPDLYDEFEGSRVSHACPFARIMEEGLVARLVQVGIRAANAHQRQQMMRFGVEVIEMDAWQAGQRPVLNYPLYLSLDLDGLDPAYAPGVSHPEPGGLTSREAIGLIHDLPAPLVGADLVEFNPSRDRSGITAALAAKLVKEILAQMLAEARDA